MATPRNTLVETPWPSPIPGRQYSRQQQGWNGDKRTVYPYVGKTCFARGTQTNTFNGFKVAIDAPNSDSVHEFISYGGIPPWAQGGYNRAYARFREKVVGETAELGAAFAEWKDSLDMIYQWVVQITRIYDGVRSGNPNKFARALGFKPKEGTTRTLGKGFSAKWLELNFGILPLMGDIHGAMSALTQPLPFGPAKGTATSYKRRFIKDQYNNIRTHDVKVRHKVQADVYLVNPNLFLMNQLGILNPLAIAWELVPFSFFVDWFVDVGSFLGSFTDWAGLELRNPCASHHCRYRDTVQLGASYYTYEEQTAFGVALVRKASIPRPIPTLQFNGNLETSLKRAANAVSILIQVLLK